jgi:hypothetical protein
MYVCIQGMFGDYAVHALWSDTTAMDNLRGAAAGAAGTLEPMSIGCGSGSVDTTHAAGSFSCVHVPTNYPNNDTDNQAYWGHVRAVGNGVTSPGVWGDNGWQRAGPGPHDYTVGDFGAGSGGVAVSSLA